MGTALGELLESSPESVDEIRRDVPRLAVLPRDDRQRGARRRQVEPARVPPLRELAGDDLGCREIETMIETEWRRTDEVLRTVTDCSELLDDVPWLKRSIAARNGYVDPLNLIQVELQLARRATATSEQSPISHTCGNWP